MPLPIIPIKVGEETIELQAECGITSMVMAEPVQLEGGLIEKEMLLELLKKAPRENPFTREELKKDMPIVVAKFEQAVIRSYLSQNSQFYDEDEVYLPKSWWLELEKAIKDKDFSRMKDILARDPRLLIYSSSMIKEKGISNFIDADSVHDKTVFHLACEHGTLEMVDWLAEELRKKDQLDAILAQKPQGWRPSVINLALKEAKDKEDQENIAKYQAYGAIYSLPRSGSSSFFLADADPFFSPESRKKQLENSLNQLGIYKLTPTEQTLLSKDLAAIQRCLAASPAVDSLRLNPIFYIALSGNLAAIQYVFDHYKELDIALDFKDELNRNVLHFVALSGNPAAIQYVTTRYKELNIELNLTDEGSRNFLHYAALSGNPAAIQCVTAVMAYYKELGIKLELDSRDIGGRNVLHFAALSGNSAAIKYVFDECYTFDINRESRDRDGANFLHYAAWSGSTAAIESVITCCRQLGVTLNPKDNRNKSALHYAALSRNLEAMLYVIEHHDVLGVSLTSSKVTKDFWKTAREQRLSKGEENRLKESLLRCRRDELDYSTPSTPSTPSITM